LPTAIAKLPDHQAQILAAGYARSVAARRAKGLVVLAVVILLVFVSSYLADVRLPVLFGHIGNFTSYLGRTVPPLSADHFGADMKAWYWNLGPWLKLLVETILMSYLGTLLGAIIGFFLCFLASANLVKSKIGRGVARRGLEFCRSVPDIVFALIFVIAFGLGPMAGVLAIAIHTVGALGKLFAELIENIDMKPVEGLSATGASWAQTVRFGVLPQVLPGFASYTLLRFEINVRGAGVMGFVGAGGIGQEFLVAIRNFYYSDVSAILLMMIATVILIDLGTEQVRHRLIGLERMR
jgi:phosphonate transport system permease protein